MKAFTHGWIVLALLVFSLSGISSAQTINLEGKWRITWLDNGKPVGKPGTINLTKSSTGGKPANLSGSFIADNGEKCAVSGFKSNDLERQLDLRVNCAKRSISINATIAVEGQQINGVYVVHNPAGSSHGDYMMDKITYTLPESGND
jgi:hypothetical protein